MNADLSDVVLHDISVVSDSVVIAVGDYGCILMSIDSGKTFQSKRFHYSLPTINSISFLKDGGVTIVGRNGFYAVSNNSGQGWEEFKFTEKNLNRIIFYDNLNGIIVGDQSTIFITSDGGSNWNKVDSPSDFNILDVVYLNLDTIFAVGTQGVCIKSTNRGNTWFKDETLSAASDLLFICKRDSISLITGGGLNIYFEYHQNTEQWYFLPKPNHQFNSMYFINDSVGIAGMDYGQAITNDGGKSWDYGEGSSPTSRFCFSSDNIFGFSINNNIYRGSSQTLYVQNFFKFGEKAYEPINSHPNNLKNLTIKSVSELLALSQNKAGRPTCLMSSDSGQSWKSIFEINPKSSNSLVDLDISKNNDIVILSDTSALFSLNDKDTLLHNSLVCKSTNEGANWTIKELGWGEYRDKISMDKSGTGLIAGMSNSFFYTRNGGADWIPDSLPVTNCITKFVDVYDDKAYFLIKCGNDNKIFIYDFQQWEEINLDFININSFELLDVSSAYTVINSQNGSDKVTTIHRTTDKFTTWKEVQSFDGFHCLNYDFYDPKTGIISTDNRKVLITKDACLSWDSLDLSQEQFTFSEYLFASNNTAYSFSIYKVLRIMFDNETPVIEGSVYQDSFYVYPNPSSAFIKSDYNFESEIPFTIINSVGLKVITGVCHTKQAIDVSFLSNGIYLFIVDSHEGKKYSKFVINH
jgi:photosystem II stability/assembly factor-like uncharacterized protein